MFSAFEIENDILKVSLEKEDALDDITVGMMQNNTFQWVAKFEVTQHAGQTALHYPLAHKKSLHEVAPNGLSPTQVLVLLDAWVSLMGEADDYMLDIGSFIMDSRFIYLDTQTNEISFLCLPLLTKKQPDDALYLLKTLLFAVVYATEQPHVYLPVIINAMQQDGFDAYLLKELLETFAAQPEQPALPQTPAQSPPQENAEVLIAQLQIEETEPEVQIEVPEALRIDDSLTQKLDLAPTGAIQPTAPALPSDAPEPADEPEATDAPDADEATDAPDADEALQPAQDAPEAPLLAALGTDDAPAQEQCEITPYDMDASGETQVLLATGEDTEEASHDTGANVEYVGQEQGVVLISYDLKEEPLPDVSQGEQAVNYADIPFGETAVLNAYSQPAEKVETAVLSQKDLYYKADPHLVQQRTGTKIPIWGDCFTLGKGYGQVNYAITDNPAISRRHAAVLTKAGEYFLLDYNSTNHTYLNDELIYSGKEVKIKHGTKVKLADETFTFYER